MIKLVCRERFVWSEGRRKVGRPEGLYRDKLQAEVSRILSFLEERGRMTRLGVWDCDSAADGIRLHKHYNLTTVPTTLMLLVWLLHSSNYPSVIFIEVPEFLSSNYSNTSFPS